ncbi:MAG: glycosyltransferase family 2 protein [Lachnospiraceae bacterium]|nr:glycosyltransferase family 2 protein [Lachnospiraceae bacterium]
MDDLISIIVPVYNVSKYLRTCLESIRTQTYRNIEVILVDDGSLDGSQKICDEYTHIDERFICIHKKNGGLSDARNEGIKLASGKYGILVDSDDYIHRDSVRLLYQNLIQYDADLSIGNYRRVKPEEAVDLDSNPNNKVTEFTTLEALGELCELEYNYFTANHIQQFTSAWNKLYKMELLKNTPFPVGKVFEDVATAHSFINSAQKVVYTEAILYFYLIREGSISRVAIKNTDMISAFENRIAFFIEKNRTSLLKNTYSTYLTVLMRTYSHLIETPDSPIIKKEIMEKIKNIYKNHKEIFEDNSKLKNETRLFITFPSLYKNKNQL